MRAHSAWLNRCDGGPMSAVTGCRGLISIGGRGETWPMGEALRGIIRRPVGAGGAAGSLPSFTAVSNVSAFACGPGAMSSGSRTVRVLESLAPWCICCAFVGGWRTMFLTDIHRFEARTWARVPRCQRPACLSRMICAKPVTCRSPWACCPAASSNTFNMGYAATVTSPCGRAAASSASAMSVCFCCRLHRSSSTWLTSLLESRFFAFAAMRP
jgi:hypothetical protein